MTKDRTDEVVSAIDELIDGAEGDWSVSGDAMRWAPEPEKWAAVGSIVALPAGYRPAGPGPSWLLGMRVIEDPGVMPGEVIIALDREVGETRMRGYTRLYVTGEHAEARIEPGLTEEARAALIERLAEAYAIPPCLVEHRWSRWSGHPDNYRRYCVRERCSAWEAQVELDGRPQEMHGAPGYMQPATPAERAAADELTALAEEMGAYDQSFTCPRCRMTSHNPNDVREGFCGNCHAWTGD